LIKVNLWQIPLIAHDLERDPHKVQYLKMHIKVTIKSWGQIRNRIVSRHRSGEGYKNFLRHWRLPRVQWPP